jgi:hypothetical protein
MIKKTIITITQTIMNKNKTKMRIINKKIMILMDKIKMIIIKTMVIMNKIDHKTTEQMIIMINSKLKTNLTI